MQTCHLPLTRLQRNRLTVKQAPLSLPGESPSDIESQSPLNPETMNRDRDRQSPTGRGVCAEVSHSSSLHLSFENETVRQAEARRHAVRRLADRYGSRTVFHAPLLVQAKKSVPMVSGDLSRTHLLLDSRTQKRPDYQVE